MRCVYFSKTKNVERFVKKIDLNAENGIEIDQINEPFLLITYTSGFGEIPDEVTAFLRKNGKFLEGVFGSGNKNWGDNYCKAAKDIANDFEVPLLMEFELAGNLHDVKKFNQIIKEKYE